MGDLILTLIEKSPAGTDECGNELYDEKRTAVFAKQRSVGLKEFSAAAQMGLRAELVIEVWSFEYGGEEEAELWGRRYFIYRSYKSGDRTELYLTKRSGIGGGTQQRV